MIFQLHDIWDEIDAATKADVYKQAQLIDKVIAKLKNGFDEKKPDILYALGYCLYMHPRKHNDFQMQIELVKVLTTVINADPNYNHAKLYLGYFLYDIVFRFIIVFT